MTPNQINEACARKIGWKKLGDGQWCGPNTISTHVPDYCGSIEAAWEIIEYWLSSKIKYRSFNLTKNNSVTHWLAEFTEGCTFFYETFDKSPSMAIALAFLKVEGE